MSQIIEWFRDSAISELVQAVLAVAALVVSIYAIRKSNRIDRRMLEIEEERESERKIKARQASLVVSLLRGDNTQLVIENVGDAEARNIALKIDGVPVLEHPDVPTGQSEIRQIGPMNEVHYLMSFKFGSKLTFEVEITWTDDSGEPGYYRTTLTY